MPHSHIPEGFDRRSPHSSTLPGRDRHTTKTSGPGRSQRKRRSFFYGPEGSRGLQRMTLALFGVCSTVSMYATGGSELHTCGSPSGPPTPTS